MPIAGRDDEPAAPVMGNTKIMSNPLRSFLMRITVRRSRQENPPTQQLLGEGTVHASRSAPPTSLRDRLVDHT
jgi:hypothetical protein